MNEEFIKWAVAVALGAIIRFFEKRKLKKKGLLKESTEK